MVSVGVASMDRLSVGEASVVYLVQRVVSACSLLSRRSNDVIVNYITGSRFFFIDGRPQPAGIEFFHDLTRVQLWIGGVDTNSLQA